MDIEFKGMTVNERLYVSGFFEKFNTAVRKKDIKKVIEILKAVEITDESSIKPILESLGLTEKRENK